MFGLFSLKGRAPVAGGNLNCEVKIERAA